MIELHPFQLKVISSFLINIAAGFILLAIGAKTTQALTIDITFVIVLLNLSFKIQQVLDEL